MDENNTAIAASLGRIEAVLSRTESGRKQRVMWALEKLAIPIAVAIVGYVANDAANKISTAQLALAKAQHESNHEEFKTATQLKYLELFYRDIVSPEETVRARAVSLLHVMAPELASSVSSFVAADPNIPTATKAAVKEGARDILVRGPLAVYKIGIYYLAGDVVLESRAKSLASALAGVGLSAVEVNPRDAGFMSRFKPAARIEVRYEAANESQHASDLADILRGIRPGEEVKTRPVRTSTPNFISIFLGQDA